MLGLSRSERPSPDVDEVDDALATVSDRLTRSANPFERLRLRESIDVQLDRRLVAMGQGDSGAVGD